MLRKRLLRFRYDLVQIKLINAVTTLQLTLQSIEMLSFCKVDIDLGS